MLGHGHILEHGTHHELTNNPHSHYSQLVNAQQLDHESYTGLESEYEELTEEEALDSGHNQLKAKEQFCMGSDQYEQKRLPARTISASTLIQEIGKLVPDTFGMYAWGLLFGIREFPSTNHPSSIYPQSQLVVLFTQPMGLFTVSNSVPFESL